MKISQETIDCVRCVSEQNHRDYLEQQAAAEATQARHDAGQAVMGNKKLALMMALAVQVDERGLDAAINCLTFHLRYPKDSK